MPGARRTWSVCRAQIGIARFEFRIGFDTSHSEIRNSKFCMPHQPTVLFVVRGNIQRQTGESLYDRKLAGRLTERGFRLEVATVPDLPYFAGLVAGAVISPLLTPADPQHALKAFAVSPLRRCS